MKILIDAFGGDHAPKDYKGAIDAQKQSDIKIVLSGKQDIISKS